MPLTDQQRARLLQIFQQKLSQCTVCQVDSWQISDSIFTLQEFTNNPFFRKGGSVYPVVPVSCNNCGQVIFFNAIKLGLLDAQPLQ